MQHVVESKFHMHASLYEYEAKLLLSARNEFLY